MILTHDGFTAEVTYEEGDELMHGRTINTRVYLHFSGRSIEELKYEFAMAVDDYRKWCAERGVEPEKPE